MASEAEAIARALVEECKQVVCYWGTGCGEGVRVCSGCSALNQSRERITAALAAIAQERDIARSDLEFIQHELEDLAASRAEGEGRVGVLREALKVASRPPLVRVFDSGGVMCSWCLVQEQNEAIAHRSDCIFVIAAKALTTTAAVAQAHDAAVERRGAQKERERCAKVAENLTGLIMTVSWPDQADEARRHVAAAIRALRDDGPEEG